MDNIAKGELEYMAYSYYNLDENEDIVLWHYLDIRYLSDILNGKLYMRRANQFKNDDPNECGMTYAQGFVLTSILKLTTDKVWGNTNFDSANTLHMVGGMEKQRSAEYYIKCFYMGEEESDFMWQNYANNNGVVIKTSLNRLKKALFEYNKDVDIVIGKVKYRKPNNIYPTFNPDFEIDAVMTKDIFFSKERELRVALHIKIWLSYCFE